MENEESKLDTDASIDIVITKPESEIKIYSKQAIWGFSIFFTSIFGGVLLFQNLKEIGKKKEAYLILLFSIIYTVISYYLIKIPVKADRNITYLCNILGALILAEVFFAKYIPNSDRYEKKKIWKPLIISLLITMPILIIILINKSKIHH